MTIFLKTKLRRRLISYTFTHPDHAYYVRELSVLIDADPGNLSRELRRLEEEGVYVSAARGREKFYSLNRSYPLYKELKTIVSKTEGVEASLKDLFRNARGIRIAFIHGSYAQNKESARSDIDLVLAGKYPSGEKLHQLRNIEKRLDREISFTSYSPDEFDIEKNKAGSFLNLVLRRKILLLKGALHV